MKDRFCVYLCVNMIFFGPSEFKVQETDLVKFLANTSAMFQTHTRCLQFLTQIQERAINHTWTLMTDDEIRKMHKSYLNYILLYIYIADKRNDLNFINYNLILKNKLFQTNKT